MQEDFGAEMTDTVGKVTKKYRATQELTQYEFIAALNESLVNTSVTRQSVSNWEADKNAPDTDFLWMCIIIYSNWRMDWAMDCLCAKLPEVFERDENGTLRTLKPAIIG